MIRTGKEEKIANDPYSNCEEKYNLNQIDDSTRRRYTYLRVHIRTSDRSKDGFFKSTCLQVLI